MSLGLGELPGSRLSSAPGAPVARLWELPESRRSSALGAQLWELSSEGSGSSALRALGAQFWDLLDSCWSSAPGVRKQQQSSFSFMSWFNPDFRLKLKTEPAQQLQETRFLFTFCCLCLRSAVLNRSLHRSKEKCRRCCESSPLKCNAIIAMQG